MRMPAAPGLLGPACREAHESDTETIRRLIHETIQASYSSVYPPRAVEYFMVFHSEERVTGQSVR